MGTTSTALTLDDLEAALGDERHNGWGYAIRSDIESASRLERLNKAVVAVANELGMNYDALFHWANSKNGRWLVDSVYGNGASPSKETVRKLMNDLVLQRDFVEEGLMKQTDNGWVGLADDMEGGL